MKGGNNLMLISDIIEEFEQGEKIRIKKVVKLEHKCPYCDEEVVRWNKSDNVLQCETWSNIDGKGYAFNLDGNSIILNNSDISLNDCCYVSELLIGCCRNCKNIFYGVLIDISNRPLNTNCGFITDSEDVLFINSVQSELYELSVSNISIGHVIVFKDVKYQDDVYDVYRIELENFEEEYEIYDKAYILTKYILRDFVEKCHTKEIASMSEEYVNDYKI